MTNHLTLEALNDLADDRLPLDARVHAEAHVRACATCAAELGELRAVLAAAESLPRDVAPPPALWSEVQATIASTVRADATATSRRTWFTPARLAAAAVALVVVSSATTVAIMNARRAAPVVAAAGSSTTPAMLPASWESTARGYEASVDELRRQLDGQRDRLAPATIATVERSLATIDAAIAEAREALRQDPANAALRELLASNYRQKVELLRRATQLTAS